MTISMLCPECGHKLAIPDRMAAKKAGCVHCKARFIVPDADAPTVRVSILDEFDENAGLPADANLPSDIAMPASLSSLERMDIDGGDNLSPAFQKAAEAEAAAGVSYDAEALGCVFWGLAFFLPPVTLIWSFFLPKGHPQKGLAFGVSGGFLVLGVVLFALLG